jgi:hypothetical protein
MTCFEYAADTSDSCAIYTSYWPDRASLHRVWPSTAILRTKSLFERVHVSFHLLVRRLTNLPVSTLRGSEEVRQVLSIDVVSQDQLVEL